MPKTCPSKLCNHENPDSNYMCAKCGIRMDMNTAEVEGRDKLYKAMKMLLDKIDPDMGFPQEGIDALKGMSRKDFDDVVGNYVGRIIIIAMDTDNKKQDTKQTYLNKPESPKGDIKSTDALEIEMEKLKVLKEISDSLKKTKSKK